MCIEDDEISLRRLNGKMASSGPDFLGIGASRSGTTWLHSMLSKHPDIWLPPLKEVHYFDSIDPTIDSPFKSHVDRAAFRYKWKLINRMKHYIGYCLKDFIGEAGNKAKPDLRWDYAFFKPGGSLEWYTELFNRPGKPGLIKGEITPAYVMLGSDTIKIIKEQLKVRKIILMLRNPIYATWSSIEKRVRDGQMQAGSTDVEDLLRRARSPRLFRQYSHADNLDRWLSYYNKSDIFIGFFEDLQQDPLSMLSRVFSYLEVEDISSQLSQDVTNRINRSGGYIEVMPDAVKQELALIHHDQVDRLRKYVGSYSESWYEEILTILKDL